MPGLEPLSLEPNHMADPSQPGVGFLLLPLVRLVVELHDLEDVARRVAILERALGRAAIRSAGAGDGEEGVGRPRNS